MSENTKPLWDSGVTPAPYGPDLPGVYVPRIVTAGYLSKVISIDRLRRTIDLSVKMLAGYDFDALAFTGMSGCLVGPSVCLALNKSMIVVRKKGDDTHSPYDVEGDKAARRYIIIDDFIGSGATVNRIAKQVKLFAPQAVCLGVLETYYQDDSDDWNPSRGKTLRKVREIGEW